MDTTGTLWVFFSPPTTYLPSLLNLNASYFLIFCFRNLLKLHFALTRQGLEKPSFLSYTHATYLLFLKLQALFPPLQCQDLHACLHYFPRPIKIHGMEKLYMIKKDLVQIQKCEKYQGQFSSVHSLLCQCQTPNL